MDDAALPNGGAVNPSFRQTDRRDVCAGERVGGPGRSKQDDAAPPNGGAVNPSFRQTDRRDVCLQLEGNSPHLRYGEMHNQANIRPA